MQIYDEDVEQCRKCVFAFVSPPGLYPEIPEASQLDFSSLKEEVPPDWLL